MGDDVAVSHYPFYYIIHVGGFSLPFLHYANPPKGRTTSLYSSAFILVLCCAVMRFGWLIECGLNCLC